jgi:hypothetical protein
LTVKVEIANTVHIIHTIPDALAHQIVSSPADKSSQNLPTFCKDDITDVLTKYYSYTKRRSDTHFRDVRPMPEAVNRPNLAGMAEAQLFKLIEVASCSIIKDQHCKVFIAIIICSTIPGGGTVSPNKKISRDTNFFLGRLMIMDRGTRMPDAFQLLMDSHEHAWTKHSRVCQLTFWFIRQNESGVDFQVQSADSR